MKKQFLEDIRANENTYTTDMAPIDPNELISSTSQNRPIQNVYEQLLKDSLYASSGVTNNPWTPRLYFENTTAGAAYNERVLPVGATITCTDVAAGNRYLSMSLAAPTDWSAAPLTGSMVLEYSSGLSNLSSDTYDYGIIQVVMGASDLNNAYILLENRSPATYTRDTIIVLEDDGTGITVDKESPITINGTTYYTKLRVHIDSGTHTVQQIATAIAAIGPAGTGETTIHASVISGAGYAGPTLSSVVMGADTYKEFTLIPKRTTVTMSRTDMEGGFTATYLNLVNVAHNPFKWEYATVGTSTPETAKFLNTGVYGFMITDPTSKSLTWTAGSTSFVYLPDFIGDLTSSMPTWFDTAFATVANLESHDLDTDTKFFPFFTINPGEIVFANGARVSLEDAIVQQTLNIDISKGTHSTALSQILFDEYNLTLAGDKTTYDDIYQAITGGALVGTENSLDALIKTLNHIYAGSLQKNRIMVVDAAGANLPYAYVYTDITDALAEVDEGDIIYLASGTVGAPKTYTVSGWAEADYTNFFNRKINFSMIALDPDNPYVDINWEVDAAMTTFKLGQEEGGCMFLQGRFDFNIVEAAATPAISSVLIRNIAKHKVRTVDMLVAGSSGYVTLLDIYFDVATYISSATMDYISLDALTLQTNTYELAAGQEANPYNVEFGNLYISNCYSEDFRISDTNGLNMGVNQLNIQGSKFTFMRVVARTLRFYNNSSTSEPGIKYSRENLDIWGEYYMDPKPTGYAGASGILLFRLVDSNIKIKVDVCDSTSYAGWAANGFQDDALIYLDPFVYNSNIYIDFSDSSSLSKCRQANYGVNNLAIMKVSAGGNTIINNTNLEIIVDTILFNPLSRAGTVADPVLPGETWFSASPAMLFDVPKTGGVFSAKNTHIDFKVANNAGAGAFIKVLTNQTGLFRITEKYCDFMNCDLTFSGPTSSKIAYRAVDAGAGLSYTYIVRGGPFADTITPGEGLGFRMSNINLEVDSSLTGGYCYFYNTATTTSRTKLFKTFWLRNVAMTEFDGPGVGSNVVLVMAMANADINIDVDISGLTANVDYTERYSTSSASEINACTIKTFTDVAYIDLPDMENCNWPLNSIHWTSGGERPTGRFWGTTPIYTRTRSYTLANSAAVTENFALGFSPTQIISMVGTVQDAASSVYSLGGDRVYIDWVDTTVPDINITHGVSLNWPGSVVWITFEYLK